jgi:ABC-type transport system substrate-binding protein
MTALLLLNRALSRPAAAASTDTLVVCDDVQDPPTLDPLNEFSEKNHAVLQLVDPKRMRFKLRRGVRFHDGEPFYSRAVVYAMAKFPDHTIGFPGRGFFGPIQKVCSMSSSCLKTGWGP